MILKINKSGNLIHWAKMSKHPTVSGKKEEND